MDNKLVKAGSSIGLYAAGGLASGIVGFLALPFFTRIFTPEDYGVIGLFTAAVALLAPSLTVGGHVFVLYEPRRGDQPSGAQGASVLLLFAATFLLAAIGLGSWAVGMLNGDALVVATLALATAFWNALVLLRLHTYQSDRRPVSYFWMSAVPPVSAFVLTMILAVRVDGWAPRLVSLLVIAAVAGGWSTLSLRAENRMSLRLGRKRIGEVFRFGAPLIVYTASIWIIGFTDRFIVAERIGLAQAGVYTVAYSLALGVSSLHDGVARFFVSRLVEWVETKEGRVTASLFAFRYSALALLSIPLFIPLAYLGLNLLAAEAFADGAELLIWLIPAQTFGGIARVFTGYLYVEKRTKVRAILGTGEAALNVLLTWFLVGEYGIVGAAVATFVTYAVSMVGTFLLARSGTALVPYRDQSPP